MDDVITSKYITGAIGLSRATAEAITWADGMAIQHRPNGNILGLY